MRMCEACEQEQHDLCGMQASCDCPCAGEVEDYFEGNYILYSLTDFAYN